MRATLLSFATALALLSVADSSATAEDPAVIARFGADADRPDSLRAVAISPDGRLIALAGEPETPTGDFAAQLRAATTGKLLHTLSGHEGPVRSLAFSSRGDLVATVTSDSDGIGLTRLFETGTGRLRLTIDAGGRLLRFVPDGRLLVAGEGRVLTFDPASGREVGRFLAMPIVRDVTLDGLRALGLSHHGQNILEVRDLAAGKEIVRLVGCAGEPLAAVFSPDGRTVAAADPKTKMVLLWEVLTGQVVHRLAAGASPLSLAFTSDSRHLLAGGVDKTIRAWEVATGGASSWLSGHEGPVTAFALGPNGSLLSGSTDRTAILWSLATVRGSSLPPGPLAKPDLDAAWDALAGPDATAAYRALGLLAHRPGELLPEIVGRVERQLVPVPDADLARLLVELDHPDYLVREQATAALAKAGDAVRPHLERALAETASPEVRSRLRLLLRRSGLTPRFSPGDLLRLRRLIGEAGSLGGDEAKRLLRLIAEEFPDPAVAAEARTALGRIAP
jgi:hypothetical protein